MDWKEKYETEKKKIQDEIEHLICQNPNGKNELDKRFLRNFGCINFKGEEFMHELNLAREYHRRMKNNYPHEHEIQNYTEGRCYNVIKCKCGFREECDTGD